MVVWRPYTKSIGKKRFSKFLKNKGKKFTRADREVLSLAGANMAADLLTISHWDTMAVVTWQPVWCWGNLGVIAGLLCVGLLLIMVVPGVPWVVGCTRSPVTDQGKSL